MSATATPIQQDDLLAALTDIEGSAPTVAGEPAAKAITHFDMSSEAAATDGVYDDFPPVHEAGNSLLPPEELEAALAEIDRLAAEEADSIPSLDEDGGAVAPAAADDQVRPAAPSGHEPALAAMVDEEPLPKASAIPEKPSSEVSPPAVAPDATKAGKGLRFVIGKKAEGGKAPDSPAAASEASKVVLPAAPHVATEPKSQVESLADFEPRVSLGKRLYRVIDGVLEALDRPFARVGAGVRRLIGSIAVATLSMSFLAVVVLPLVLPHRDAIAFLEEKREDMQKPKPAASAHGEAEAKEAGGHGKPAAKDAAKKSDKAADAKPGAKPKAGGGHDAHGGGH